eukprot:scaffold2.g7478.t1
MLWALRGLCTALRHPRGAVALLPSRATAMAPKRKASTSPAAAPDAQAAGEQAAASPSKRRQRRTPAKAAAAGAPAAAEAGGAPPAAKPAAKGRGRGKAAAAAPKSPPGPVYDASMRPPPLAAGQAFKVLSWNVAGLRALLKKDPQAISRLVEEEQPDEHKLQTDHCGAVTEQLGLKGWHAAWNCRRAGLKLNTDKKGYSGVAVLSRAAPLSVAKGLDRRRAEAAGLQGGELGPRAGFTQEERDSFARLLLGECGLVDAFRRRHPGVVGYTYWSFRSNARASNKGWRLDFFLVSSALAEGGRLHDAYHLPAVAGSDHCPVGLVLKKE